jgi:signal transduction histidine kinase
MVKPDSARLSERKRSPSRLANLWRTTTVRLTGLFILIFVVASIVLLAFMAYQSAIVLQRQQAADIDREVIELQRLEDRQGVRAMAVAVQRYANRPGPGIYYLGDDLGNRLVGNIAGLPADVLANEGFFTFDYDRDSANAPEEETAGPAEERGFAAARSVLMQSGLRLVVGRDVVERRGFSAIVFQGFLLGVGGIVLLSVLAGGLTAQRVLKRIDSISGTSAKIMSGALSERVPVTRRHDEFDELATDLNAMLDRIEQLMQGLKEVTDNVAHDLKTPLTRLRNKAESALREGRTPEQLREALETTIAESDQLIRTFNALLMIARVEAGTPSGALEETDLSAVAEDVAELYQPVVEDAGLALVPDIEPGVTLRANRELIGQALVNLLENAIKYAGREDGEGKISLSVARTGGRIRIRVSDNGPGIPEGDREHVVKRFVRLEKSRTEPGSGLGLSLVLAVARLHHGDLLLEDNKPGLSASLDLPAA